MSLEAMVWVLSGDAPVADVNEYAVLGAMADKADPDGCGSWLSKETISSRVHVSEETVKRCWRNMQRRGLIARGDQSLVRHYRADRRPVVYDLLIPFTWFSNVDRVNAERARMGRDPLTPESRPPLAPAPVKPGRADKGKPRPKKATEERGNSETPREETSDPTHGGTTSRRRGHYKSSTGELVVPQNSPVTQSPTGTTEPVLPSVFDVQVSDAIGSNQDGGTDGGGGEIEDQEHGPVSAGGEPAAARAAPGNDGSNGGRGAPLGSGPAVQPVDLTPGVEVLRAVAAEAPEWAITHADSLRDQGLVVTGMLEIGFTAQEVRHALVSKPLPRPLRATVGAVVARRLRDLIAIGPAMGVRPIPAQSTGGSTPAGHELKDRDETPAPASWAEQRARLEAEVSGVGRHRPCAGDEGMCPRLALPGMDLCSVCLGGEQPTCAVGCGRGVVAHTMSCIACTEPAEDPGVCPGHGGQPCGRPVLTEGLCRRCKFQAEEARRAAEAECEAARDAAVAAATAAEAQPAPA